MLRALLLGLAFLLAACAAAGPAALPSTNYRLVGYVVGHGPMPYIDAEKLSAINYAFGYIDKDGKVALDGTGAVEFIKNLEALKARNPQLKILISVGGWGADGFSDAAADESSRATFAQSAADLMASTGADGIDLDWEYPGLPGPGIRYREEDRRNFTLLLQALRERFDLLGARLGRSRQNHLLITAALADGEFVAHIELDQIHKQMDWINLMTYDFHNSLTKTTGHHSALSVSATSAADERSVDRAVAQFLAAGVPGDKLVVGVPFYGRAFADVVPQNYGLDQTYGHYGLQKDLSWPRLAADFIDRNGYVRHWDEKAQEPYLWNAQENTFVTYDDPQSLALKAAFVKSHHLGGMMYWEQSQDPDGELLGLLFTKLHGSR